MTAAAEAHRMEIWEGLMQAAIRGETDKFRQFNQEWNRLNERDGLTDYVQFGGDPVHYVEQGSCGHCHKDWILEGIRFGDFLPGYALSIHMDAQCPNWAECRCWSDLPRPEGDSLHPLCQGCGEPFLLCGCPEGCLLGPCAEAEKAEWLQRAEQPPLP